VAYEKLVFGSTLPAICIRAMEAHTAARRSTAATRIVRWKEFGFGSLIFSVLGAFLAFTVGGWVAGRISGYRWSEPAILHGAIAWLVGVSLIVALSTIGTTAFGPWYRGIGGFRVPAVAAPAEDPDAARAA
jgi:hypothetical protein